MTMTKANKESIIFAYRRAHNRMEEMENRLAEATDSEEIRKWCDEYTLASEHVYGMDDALSALGIRVAKVGDNWVVQS